MRIFQKTNQSYSVEDLASIVPVFTLTNLWVFLNQIVNRPQQGNFDSLSKQTNKQYLDWFQDEEDLAQRSVKCQICSVFPQHKRWIEKNRMTPGEPAETIFGAVDVARRGCRNATSVWMHCWRMAK